jgi:hypothetical protein
MACVEVPTREHGSEAYVPAEPDADREHEWPPASREIAIERARQARTAKEGLPVDVATLERVADAVMDPGYQLPGLFLTVEECADDERMDDEDDRLAAVEEYLRRHAEIDGGIRFGWRDGRRTLYVGLVGDAESHKRPLSQIGGDRMAFEQLPRTLRELEEIKDRIGADRAELQAEGFDLLVIGTERRRGVARVQLVGGRDAAAAEQHFAARYGQAAAVEWLGPSRLREVPHPFGSWTSQGRLLRVFFGLDHNGQQRGEARVAEESGERIVIALSRLQPVGPTTQIGGFQPHHVDLQLREPVGNRAVIDASAGVPRPSLAQLGNR